MRSRRYSRFDLRRPAAVAATTFACLAGVACGSTEAPPAPPASAAPATFEPTQSPLRRLRTAQYQNAIATLFSVEVALSADPPADPELNGYTSIASAQLALNDDLVRDYQLSATAVATAAMGDGARIAELLDCNPSGPDDAACMTSFVQRLGRLAFRRPLTTEETDDYLDVGLFAAEEANDFYAGLEYIIVSLLQSPSFLFIVEVGEPMPEDTPARRLTSYETAARMAFFLTDAPPDDALLDAAEAGELDTPEGRQEAALTLLDRPTARRALRNFFTEYLVLDGLELRAKDPNLYPAWDATLARSMREETLRLLDDIIWTRDADVREMFTADYTFVNTPLAEKIYDVPAPQGGDSAASEWGRIDLPADQGRSGILSHPSVLARQANPESTSATHRGLFVLERFLCRTMPPPPEGVVTELPPSSTAPTMRERVAVHLEDPTCAGCHTISDPLGLSLENYDPIGVYRAKENGAVIDASADHIIAGEFVGAKGLGQALAGLEDSTLCLVRNLYRHGTGHVETEGELPLLSMLRDRMAEDGYSLRSFLVNLVSNDAFVTIEANDNIADYEARMAEGETQEEVQP